MYTPRGEGPSGPGGIGNPFDMNSGQARTQPLVLRRAALQEIIDLRWRVLRTNQPRDTVIFPGDEAPTSVHVAVFDGGRSVGCASLHLGEFEQRPAWQLRGVAVDPGWRNRHIGQSLMSALEAHIRHAGPLLTWANARVSALGFYLRLGWEVVSEEFDLPIAGRHVRIRRDLARQV